MTSHIAFTETGFSFDNDGIHYDVRAEVGDGLARIIVKETSLQQEQAMEAEDES